VLIGFSFATALGAVLAWAWIPEVQNPRGSDADDSNGGGSDGGTSGGRGGRGRGRRSRSSKKRRTLRKYEVPSKSLEELAPGRAAVVDEGLKVGFRHRGGLMVGRMGRAVRRRKAKA
jgi:hypothetical protein